MWTRRSRTGVSLRHILLAGGSVAEWAQFSESQWQERVDMLVGLARAVGVEFITVHPHGLEDRSRTSQASGAVPSRREEVRRGIRIVVDPVTDGRERIRQVVADWPTRRALDEKALGRALFADAGEPDLVIVLGPPNRLPTSLVWELAYGELVFIDTQWAELSGDHVQTAIADFSSRRRRFGGVE